MKKHIEVLADTLWGIHLSIGANEQRAHSIECVLENDLRPICQKAIIEHNKNSVCKISESFGIDFGKDRSFELDVMINDRTGQELNEFFTSLDDPEEQFGSKLRPIMERLLQEADIPLVFTGINVPVHYFCK